MPQFKIWFDMEKSSGSVVLNAASEEAAKSIFNTLEAEDVLELSRIIPKYEIDDVAEIGDAELNDEF